MRRSRTIHLLFIVVLGLAGFQGLAAATQPTPGASPVATPAGSARSCGAPGYHPVVFEDVTAAEIEAAGLSGQPIVLGQETTIEAGDGTPVTLPAGWLPERGAWIRDRHHVGLVWVFDEDTTTGVLLATGETWSTSLTPAGSGFGASTIGPWHVGATDDTNTDFWIVNPDTGTLLFTSEVFGTPFDEARRPGILSGPSLETPVVLAFIVHGADKAPDALVLPSADPADAWVLDPDDAGTNLSAAITRDGSRLALVEASGEIRVLDGLTGEHVATHTLPEQRTQVRAIGFGSDDTSLLLFGDQTLWTVDIDTGETTTPIDPGEITTFIEPDAAVHEIPFDPSTGTALVPIDDSTVVWIDPASGDMKEVEIEHLSFPQDGWMVVNSDDGRTASYMLLDMATGEIAAGPVTMQSTEYTDTPTYRSGKDGVWTIPGDPGELIVLDGPGGKAFTLPVPEEDTADGQSAAHGASPNGECIIYTRLGSGLENPPGISWIAPLEPDAAWTEIPFEINGWLVIPTGPEVQQAGRDQDATPVPAATPAG
ncbi:MAG TPA: hypothetical protein VD789_00835 [Thermomicrobiales bacterium]|nr:hypothetical protein [Thermomicrobiales bacterium]